MTLEEASEALSRFVPDSSMKENYTLDRMHALMDRLGNPQDTYRSVHVAVPRERRQRRTSSPACSKPPV